MSTQSFVTAAVFIAWDADGFYAVAPTPEAALQDLAALSQSDLRRVAKLPDVTLPLPVVEDGAAMVAKGAPQLKIVA